MSFLDELFMADAPVIKVKKVKERRFREKRRRKLDRPTRQRSMNPRRR